MFGSIFLNDAYGYIFSLFLLAIGAGESALCLSLFIYFFKYTKLSNLLKLKQFKK